MTIILTGQQLYTAPLSYLHTIFSIQNLKQYLISQQKLHTLEMKPSPLCSFCNSYDETPYNIFSECDCVKCLWRDLVKCFQNNLTLLNLNTTDYHFWVSCFS